MWLEKCRVIGNKTIEISGSKSISNRLLILQYLFGNIKTENLSNSQDTAVLQQALATTADVIDVHHAGTAMRFLTAYFAIQEGRSVTLTGSPRMQERPVKSLVDALLHLGADIQYLKNDGYPPLKITGKKLRKSNVTIPADISSQFITALLLIGAKLDNGITITLDGEITSRPYLEMTLKILRSLEIEYTFEDNIIRVFPDHEESRGLRSAPFIIESDWSSASYYYSLAALSGENINLRCFKPYSLQGDSVLREIYWKYFGVNTISDGAAAKISLYPETNHEQPDKIVLHMNDCPDIAQTLCVTAAAKKIHFELTGLSTLRIKETNRLLALHQELKKIGCMTEISDDRIASTNFFPPEREISIATYNDHRMAMSFAPFALITGLTIENPEVVEKSYPAFWEDFALLTEKY
ncbi:3-phosphoshikimate 1-carboxyvinyltransferase [Chryseobacterium sp. 6424]|uniref:3-phosphoshikimate 1-carboxyvinyltransferase n=1 Tax=Chryseobacterium sp. 6424 TaxID=2039166 RepID=UPI001623607B|nr:3-phosphoshikimate 1-carboxyvinyltransferase [Chryseobacterium sp. 6424]